MIDWSVEGVSFGNCNCDYGCSCQFERRPTHSHCRGFEVVRIDKDHFADVPLDGLHASLWMTSSIGMAAGAGLYQIAVAGVIFAVLIVTVLGLVMRFLPMGESSSQKDDR